MYRSAWVADYPAIEDFLNPLFRTGSASNAGGYTNPAVDKLLTDADSAPTAEQSSQLYQQAERQVLQDMPVVPIFFQAATSCWSTRLTGVVPTQFRELDLESVRVRPASSGK
jgi:oligopeptide transport system substrate-binding protein